MRYFKLYEKVQLTDIVEPKHLNNLVTLFINKTTFF